MFKPFISEHLLSRVNATTFGTLRCMLCYSRIAVVLEGLRCRVSVAPADAKIPGNVVETHWLVEDLQITIKSGCVSGQIPRTQQ